MNCLILTINPGSTNTKIGLFRNEECLLKETIQHQDLDNYLDIFTQKHMRKKTIEDFLEKNGYQVTDLSAVVGRGGILPPIQTGGYRVNQKMLDLLQNGELTPHASNLGAILADEVARDAGGCPAFIYDAVSASDFPPIAQVTGIPGILRQSFSHVLNSRAVARHYADERGKRYEDMNFIVAHLGGGITINVHQKGKIIDSLSDDNGPFSPERVGSIPLLDFIDYCFSGKSKDELKKMVRGGGGLKAHLGTSNCSEIVNRMLAGDEKAKLLLDAQAYQIAKGIGMMAAVLKGLCDAILITGGIANSEYIVGQVVDYVRFIAPVTVIPGEFELEAMAEGALRILKGEEPVHEM